MDATPSKAHNLAWRKFLAAHALTIEQIQQDLAAANLPPLEWYDVLFALFEAPDHRLRLHELAQVVLLSRSNITRLVDRLEAAKLIQRERCQSDRRGAYAVITEAGIAMQQQMWTVYAQGINKYFACHLPAAEVKAFTKVFKRITDAANSKNVQVS